MFRHIIHHKVVKTASNLFLYFIVQII